MDNVKTHNTCTNVPSSQTFRSLLKKKKFKTMLLDKNLVPLSNLEKRYQR
jgi:hypothetical protein